MAGADIEELVRAVERKLAKALQLFVVTYYKSPIYPITNTNLVYSHKARDTWTVWTL
jgi:hypothetical protein